MTKYNVHIYREMRLRFDGIEAESPDEAAEKARILHFDEADDWSDCEGESLAALVDVAGDEEYGQSCLIDFEAERQRKAAAEMLAALTLAQQALNTAPRFRVGVTDSYKIAAAVDRAITKARMETKSAAACGSDLGKGV